jgi:predicted phosphate transport protein (TIGR00153 family)
MVRSTVAFRLFARHSAFYPMFTEAGRNVSDSADALAGLLDPNANREAIAHVLRENEHAGDSVTHRIMRQLNTSRVTPFDREDIYRLASALDDVVDVMEATADFIVLSDIGKLPTLMSEQLTLLVKSAHETADAMGRLSTMRDLEPYWIEVNRLENEADRVYRKLLSKLLSGDYDALAVIKLREVADGFEDAADALEHVAHAVETIAVKAS